MYNASECAHSYNINIWIACEEGHMDWPSTILIPAEKGWYRGKGPAGSMDNGDFMGFNGDLVEFNGI
jgi:hypothetical protein